VDQMSTVEELGARQIPGLPPTTLTVRQLGGQLGGQLVGQPGRQQLGGLVYRQVGRSLEGSV